MSVSTTVLALVALAALSTCGFACVVLYALRGANPAQRVEILKAAATSGRAWPLLMAIGINQRRTQRGGNRHHERMALNDWLPQVVTTIGGTAVGLGGVYSTLRSGKRQQETALEVSRHQAESQAKQAREDREQRRWELAYEELVQWIENSRQVVIGSAAALPFSLGEETHRDGERLMASFIRKLQDDSGHPQLTDELQRLESAWSKKPSGWSRVMWSEEITELEAKLQRAVHDYLQTHRILNALDGSVPEELRSGFLNDMNKLRTRIDEQSVGIVRQARSDLQMRESPYTVRSPKTCTDRPVL